VRRLYSIILLVAVGMLMGCRQDEFEINSSLLFPCKTRNYSISNQLISEQDTLALYISGSAKDTEAVEISVTAPNQCDTWTFQSKGTEIEGSLYFGSSSLAAPYLEKGTYQIKAIRADGRSAQTEAILSWSESIVSMPSVSIHSGNAYLEGNSDVSFSMLDATGAVLRTGKGESVLSLEAGTSILKLSYYDMQSNMTLVSAYFLDT